MKKLYLIVDMQNDFVDGALGFDKAPAVVDAITHSLMYNLKPQDVVMFTRDTHGEDYLNTQEGRKLPVKHCIKETLGWQIVDALKPWIREDTLIFDKPTFGSLELGIALNNFNFDVVEIMGLVSNICIISNAVIVKAALPEAQIIIDRACTASFDTALDEAAMQVMEGLQIDIKGKP